MSAAVIIGLLIQIISSAIGGLIFQGWGPGLTSGDPLGVGYLLLQAAIGAVGGAILTVFASLFWNPIDY
jgi:hypothetical protein